MRDTAYPLPARASAHPPSDRKPPLSARSPERQTPHTRLPAPLYTYTDIKFVTVTAVLRGYSRIAYIWTCRPPARRRRPAGGLRLNAETRSADVLRTVMIDYSFDIYNLFWGRSVTDTSSALTHGNSASVCQQAFSLLCWVLAMAAFFLLSPPASLSRGANRGDLAALA